MHDCLAVGAPGIWITGIHCAEKLGGDHCPISSEVLVEEITENDLRVPFCIDIGGVDKIAAALKICTQNGMRSGFVCAKAPFLTKGHGTQAERADSQTASAQCDVIV
ncbi:MAG: hypothetical protein BWY75_03455 [bacterium ADurb.Bin425]|nr:MAG: hypothetical protein BWY75_03455 [bacterium ADurb.Bin425]